MSASGRSAISKQDKSKKIILKHIIVKLQKNNHKVNLTEKQRMKRKSILEKESVRLTGTELLARCSAYIRIPGIVNRLNTHLMSLLKD